ncbi:MAG: hypothetical protein ABIJ86_02740 [Spirochaetota bacterium]
MYNLPGMWPAEVLEYAARAGSEGPRFPPYASLLYAPHREEADTGKMEDALAALLAVRR